MSTLAEREIRPPRSSDAAALEGDQLEELYGLLGNEWGLVGDHHLEKEYKFKDFKEALAFTNAVGELAELVDHHPEICLTWGRAKVTLWTHSVGGLSEADFVFAAKSDLFVQS
jgi:4a-hydroxytetrahydrobiopterin dehydratase